MTRVRIFLCLAALLASVPAHAQLTEDQRLGRGENRQGAFELGVNLGAQLFNAGSDAQGLKNAFTGEIRVGYRAMRPIGLELGLGFVPTSALDNSLSVFALNPHFDVVFDILQFKVRPYVGLGFGGMIYTAPSDSIAHLEGHFQAGLKVAIWRDLAFRAEAKVMFHNSSNPVVSDKPIGYFVNGIFTGGLMYSWGGKPYRIDRDSDGIFDEDDKCPDVPGEKAYDGCPPPVDSDKDGINDDRDQCPDVPGVEQYNGCPPPDQDGDGVTDDKDKCPAEPGPASNEGCPEVALKDDHLILKQALFETNKANILPEYGEVLDAVAAFLVEHKELELVGVYGHTDVEGTRQRNQALSVERSQAVADYLVSKGVSKKRLVAKGFGQDKPLASNKSLEGKAKNRRVEFVILQRSEGNVSGKATPTPAPKVAPAPVEVPVVAPTPVPVQKPVVKPEPLPELLPDPEPVAPTPAPAPVKKEEKPKKDEKKKDEPKKEEKKEEKKKDQKKTDDLGIPELDEAPPAPAKKPAPAPEPAPEEKEKDDRAPLVP